MKTKNLLLSIFVTLALITGSNARAEESKPKKKIIQIEVDEDSEVVELKKDKSVHQQVEQESEDPASSRVIYGPTALPNTHPRKFRLTAFDLGLWNLDYAASKDLNIGVQFAPPLGVYMLGATVRYNHALSENVHVGVYGNAGVLGVISSDTVTYFGAGPILTIGDSKKSLTFSALTYGGFHSSSSGYVTLPGMGGSIQVSNRVKLNLEGYYFITPRSDNKFTKAGAVLYGARIFSETGSVYGDISFLIPIYKDTGDFLRYVPLGIPVIAFGFSW